jgi:hypothetical protein
VNDSRSRTPSTGDACAIPGERQNIPTERRAASSPSRSRARTPSTRDPIAGARSELRVRALLPRVGGRVCTREALCAARRRDASRLFPGTQRARRARRAAASCEAKRWRRAV